jgi:hypothetical protein
MSKLGNVLCSLFAALVLALLLPPPTRAAVPEQPRLKTTSAASRYLPVELALFLCGYDPGPIDGVLSAETKAAIESFRRDRLSHSSNPLEELAQRSAAVSSLLQPEFRSTSGTILWKVRVIQAAHDLKLIPTLPNIQRMRAQGAAKQTETKSLLLHTPPAPPSTPSPTDGAATSPSWPPPLAENGDVRGVDNDGDGRIEPVYVRGYYRKDGTYVRSHYRARPGY